MRPFGLLDHLLAAPPAILGFARWQIDGDLGALYLRFEVQETICGNEREDLERQ